MHGRMTAIVLATTVAAAANMAARPRRVSPPRLYVLDCGTLVGRNLRSYGLPPEARDLSVACALVVDGNRTLLWETGLGDRLAANGATPTDAGWLVKRTLRSQLASIGVEPAAITFLAISHS